MDYWLQCNISLGQFTGEYVVEATDFRDRLFSLFTPAEFVEYDAEPLQGQTVAGRLRVEPLAKDAHWVLVRLPRTPLENGATVTVLDSQLTQTPAKELA
jgi:hypothetical protein